MNKNNTICFVAGRSGGHIKPALTLAKQYCTKNPAAKILFFTTTAPLDMQIVTESNQDLIHLPLSLGTIPRNPFLLVIYFFKLIWYTKKSFLIFFKYKPQKVISMGGYISIPVCLAAKLMRIPIELYELNAIPGKATKFLAHLCSTINVCFDTARTYFPPKKVHFVPYPLDLSSSSTKKKFTGNDKKIVLILGGSQGSLFINKIIKAWIQENSSLHNQVYFIHQTGNSDPFDWKAFYQSYQISAEIFAYTNSLEHYYQIADLIICRAGAGTLFETLFFKKLCIVIPLETSSTDHQVFNAQALAKQYPTLYTTFEQKEIAQNTEQLFQYMNTVIDGTKKHGLNPELIQHADV